MLNQSLNQELVSGELLHGFDEQIVQGQFPLVLAGHGLQKPGESRPRRRRSFDGFLCLLPVVDEGSVGLGDRGLGELDQNLFN